MCPWYATQILNGRQGIKLYAAASN
jgi:hypothetical protein